MDEKQFATITKAMGREMTRRGAVGRLAAGLVATSGLAAGIRGASAASEVDDICNYYIDAECVYDAGSDQTTCTFTGLKGSDKEISHTNFLTGAFCAKVVAASDGVECGIDDPSTGIVENGFCKYNTPAVDPYVDPVFALTFDGYVYVDGEYCATCATAGCTESAYIIKAGTSDFYAPGDRLVCGEPPMEYEGCTPGYWKNHPESWAATGYSTGQTIGSVFNTSAYSGTTLMQALSLKGGSGLDGGMQILLRAAVAALLNAASPDVDYLVSTADVIAAVNAALSSGSRDGMIMLAAELDGYNNAEGGCPLGGSVSAASRKGKNRKKGGKKGGKRRNRKNRN